MYTFLQLPSPCVVHSASLQATTKIRMCGGPLSERTLNSTFSDIFNASSCTCETGDLHSDSGTTQLTDRKNVKLIKSKLI